MAVAENQDEGFTMASMRGRLMAYSKGMRSSRQLRCELQRVTRVAELEQIRDWHLTQSEEEELAVEAA